MTKTRWILLAVLVILVIAGFPQAWDKANAGTMKSQSTYACSYHPSASMGVPKSAGTFTLRISGPTEPTYVVKAACWGFNHEFRGVPHYGLPPGTRVAVFHSEDMDLHLSIYATNATMGKLFADYMEDEGMPGWYRVS